jgi:hypothetical protein
MVNKGDRGEHDGILMAHETDVPLLQDAFSSRWGDCWEDALD